MNNQQTSLLNQQIYLTTSKACNCITLTLLHLLTGCMAFGKNCVFVCRKAADTDCTHADLVYHSVTLQLSIDAKIICFFIIFLNSFFGYREDVHPRQADAVGDSDLNLMSLAN